MQGLNNVVPPQTSDQSFVSSGYTANLQAGAYCNSHTHCIHWRLKIEILLKLLT